MTARGWVWQSALCWSVLAPVAMAASVEACPAMPVPPAATLQSVAQDTVMNGLPMSIRLMNTAQTPQQVLAFYRQAWPNRPGRKGNVEYRIAPWAMIAAQLDDCFYTVQVQAGTGSGGSVALLGVSRKLDVAPAPGEGLPAMAGSRVVNDLRSMDAGKAGRLLVISNTYSGTGNASFYREQMAHLGWSLVKQGAPRAADTQAIVLVFRRGAGWADFSIKQGPRATAVVANIND